MSLSVAVSRRVKAPVGDAWIRRAIAAALKADRQRGSREVSVAFVGDPEMTRLNAKYRGKRKTTDVLSFGDDGAWPGRGGEKVLGDLVISMPQVLRQAKAAKKPLRAEIALMLVHGTLHLLGYDHETLKDEHVMFPLQNRILKTLGYA